MEETNKETFTMFPDDDDCDWIEELFDIEEFEKTTERGYPLLPNGDVICGRMLYLQGLVYCSLDVSVIAAFNVALKQWKILPYPHIGYEHFIHSDYLIDSGSGRDSNNSLLIAKSRVLFQDPYSS